MLFAPAFFDNFGKTGKIPKISIDLFASCCYNISEISLSVHCGMLCADLAEYERFSWTKGDIYMKKDYQAPEVELISLIAEESVTLDTFKNTLKGADDIVDGDMGTASSIF